MILLLLKLLKKKARPITTYTGQDIDVFNLQPEQIKVNDITHALAHLCRFGGHTRRFYSVAEHSVRVHSLVSDQDRNTRLWALLHDAPEAYLIDLPTPIKEQLPGYRRAEKRIVKALAKKFGISPQIPYSVLAADAYVLNIEMEDIFTRESNPNFVPLSIRESRAAFRDLLLSTLKEKP